jgi:hypothetical protein
MAAQPAAPKKASKAGRNLILLGATVLAVVCFVAGVAVGGPSRSTRTATPGASTPVALAPANTQSPLSSQAPVPTYTPYPTYTPGAPVRVTVLATVLVDRLVTATHPPDFTLVQELSGNGNGSTDLFALDSGIVRIKWAYTGDSNFILYLKRLDNDAQVNLENAIGSVEGQKIMNVGASDQYLIEALIASGPWTVTIEFMP